MKKIDIVIADEDENFAVQVQNRLESLIGDSAEITIITDREYLLKYFETPRSIDALLIGKTLYFRAVEKHNIDYICVTTDNPQECRSDGGGFLSYVYRFSSLGDISEKLISRIEKSALAPAVQGAKCRLVLVTSPIGGSGKTSAAVGICSALKKYGKKVLFVDTSSLQTSAYLFNCRKKNKEDGYIADQFNASSIKNITGHGSFDFITPFGQALPALGVTLEDYVRLTEEVKHQEQYDYIVADTSSEFSVELTKLMSLADYVLILTLQDQFSVYKLQKFLKNIDCSDTEKYKLFCSIYRAEKKSFLSEQSADIQFSGYIPLANFSDEKDPDVIGNMKCYMRIAAMLT